MPADPSVFNQFLQPVKSVDDYSNEMDKQKLNALQLVSQTRMNDIAGLQADQTRRTLASSAMDQNALQRVASGWNADTTPQQRIADLRNTGRPALLDHADNLEKSATALSVGNATAANLSAEAQAKLADTKYKALDRHAQDLGMVQTPEDVQHYIQVTLALNGIPPEQQGPATAQAMQKYQELGLDGWKKAASQGAIPVVEQAKIDAENKRAQLTADTSIKTTGMNNATSIATNAATNATTQRGQNLSHKDAGLENGKAPPGYVWGPPDANGTPTMIAVTGGPADLKKQGALNQDTQALTGAISGFDRLGTAANEVLKHPGLDGIAGWRGSIPNAPGSQAADAQALLGTLKSQVGFGVLQDMRNNSKTGGALGSVSDAEGKRLESNLAALDHSQSIGQLKANLQKIIDYADQAKDRTREAFNMKHGGPAGAPKASDQSPPAANNGWTVKQVP